MSCSCSSTRQYGSLYCSLSIISHRHIGIAGAWEALLVYDCIIFGLTIYKTWTARVGHVINGIRVPLITLFLRDGMSKCVHLFQSRWPVLPPRSYIFCVSAEPPECLRAFNLRFWDKVVGALQPFEHPNLLCEHHLNSVCFTMSFWHILAVFRGMCTSVSNCPFRGMLTFTSLSCAAIWLLLLVGK